MTTGLSTAAGYIKDNRLLPAGFDKQTASNDIATVGEAATDADFTGNGDIVRYSVPLNGSSGPYRVQAELWYQPIGYRWAHNLASYAAGETQRFIGYYDSMSAGSALMLAHAEANR